MLKIALAAQSAVADDPARVLAGLNDSLCGKFEAHFITAGYLFLGTDKGGLRYAGAGHPPLFVGSLNGGKQAAFRAVECNGLMLGLFPGATYSSVEMPFRPHDRCVLYTDGALEAQNTAQEEFGASRFRNFLENAPGLAATALIDALRRQLSAWSGRLVGRVQDDAITLIVVAFPRVSVGGITR